MTVNGFIILSLLSIQVFLTQCAYLQQRDNPSPCSTLDIIITRNKLNADLAIIKYNCINAKKTILYGLLQNAVAQSSSLGPTVLECLQNVISLIAAAIDRLQDALNASCDIGVRQQSQIDVKFNRIIAELKLCVEHSNGCCECQKNCCIQKRNQFYQNIEADIALLKQQYTNCVTNTCRVINSDIDKIQEAVNSCVPPTTTPEPFTTIEFTYIEECIDTTTPFIDTTSSTYVDTTPTSDDTTTSSTEVPGC